MTKSVETKYYLAKTNKNGLWFHCWQNVAKGCGSTKNAQKEILQHDCEYFLFFVQFRVVLED